MSDGPSSGHSLVPAYLSKLVSRPQGEGVAINLVITAITQVVSTLIAVGLGYSGFSDATVVIIYVLGVLFCVILTVRPVYGLVASFVSILSYNYFLIAPRFSLRIDAPDYAATITAMALFALVTSYLVSVLRTSSRQSTEAQLVAQREQLRANLLRSVSHDLRTPLTSICGNADILLDDEVSLTPQARKKLLGNIYDDATWLRTVVENLLAVTRLEDGDVMLHVEVELVDDVIEEAMRHISRNAKEHRIVVVPSGELLLARMDPQVIVQVIVNLVNNAIDHTQKGSTIVIESGIVDNEVFVSVSDNGPGVGNEDKDQVFDLFYTGRSSSADSGRSMGLGLSLCRSIVLAHGGRIYVEDVEPHGARFVFTLPAEEVITNG